MAFHPITKKQINGKVMLIISFTDEAEEDTVCLHIFKKADDFNHLSIPRLNTHEYPLLVQSSMQEVLKTSDTLQIKRSDIIDMAFFMLPIQFIADGMYCCICITNANLYLLHSICNLT